MFEHANVNQYIEGAIFVFWACFNGSKRCYHGGVAELVQGARLEIE